MAKKNLTIQADDRVAIIGKTGSGKTYFARFLVASFARLIVIDSKGDINPARWNLETVPDNWSERTPLVRKLLRGENVRLRFRAPMNGDYRPILRLVWAAKNVTLYIDEVLAVVPERRPAPMEFDSLYTRGRSSGIGVIASAQRPRAIPPNVMAQAEWIFAFSVPRPEDRKYVSGYMDGYRPIENRIPHPHGFWTYNASWPNPVYTDRYVPNTSKVAPKQTTPISGVEANGFRKRHAQFG